jgi:hypothetical protein
MRSAITASTVRRSCCGQAWAALTGWCQDAAVLSDTETFRRCRPSGCVRGSLGLDRVVPDQCREARSGAWLQGLFGSGPWAGHTDQS